MAKRRLETRLIHHPGGICDRTGAVSVPIYLVSTFRQGEVGADQEFEYSRTGNPTRQVLERYIADLEGGQQGFAFASGMAAISAALMILRSGDHLIATQGLYGGSYRLLTQVLQEYGISCTFLDTGDAEAMSQGFRDNTRAIFIETPSNPLMRVSDLRVAVRMASERGIFTIVDNTFMTPLLQRPLELGVDVVVHSGTKYLGGHSDVLLGLVATRSEELAGRIGHLQNAMGAVPSPLDCWLLIRGMKTLAVRVDRAQAGAVEIARWLAGRDEVEKVYYTGLDSHERVEVHRGQAAGPGAIISFRLAKDLSPEGFLGALRIWTLAVSLGAVESIVTQPARMTHLSYPESEKDRLQIDDHVIRLSVGIESVQDLIADLEAGFQSAS